MNEWLDPVYKKLASSELGAGHTAGIVPATSTASYFGVPKQTDTHTIGKIFVEFWAGGKSKIIAVNVNYFKSRTHEHIHLTGNISPAYREAGAEVGDVIVFWKSALDPNSYKAELIKPNSKRWDLVGDSAFHKPGGRLILVPPNFQLNDQDTSYEVLSEVEDRITEADFPTTLRQERRRVGERSVTIRNKAKGDFVLRQQAYKCQVNPCHISFITRLGVSYMEKHHLIPMMYYEDFVNDLDDVANIVSLCPNCHRHIHLGNSDEVSRIIESLFDQQKDKLSTAGFNISLVDLKKKYDVS